MEGSLDAVMSAAPVTKTEVAESSSEHKVEQLSNGTVETSMNHEKVVSQSFQSSSDQVFVQKSVVQEVKQESFSTSTSSTAAVPLENVDEKPSEPAAIASQEIQVENAPQIQKEVEEAKDEVKTEVASDENAHVGSKNDSENSNETEKQSEIVETETETSTTAEPVKENQQQNVVEIETEIDDKIQQNAEQPEAPVVQPTIVAAEPSMDVVDEAPRPVNEDSQPHVESTQLVAPPVESVVFERKQSTVVTTDTVEVANNSVINGESPKEPEVVAPSAAENFGREIQQESIKQQLNEIITDIEKNVNISSVNETVTNDEAEVKKPIDLQKIFTPATDTEEILPGKNRKLFASSSFYSPVIHPTVEDQVELARRISHSLSDVHNQTSKGQTMYVNRKKRSVKWIHDDGHEEERFVEEQDERNDNGIISSSMQQQHEVFNSENEPRKVPLKLLMDPRHVQDCNTARAQYGYDQQPAPMSPEFGYELVNALNAPNGKGAELFAKRRKKAEKWVIDGTNNTQQPQNFPPNPASSIIAYSDVGTQHVQRNIMMDQVQANIISSQQRVKLVKSPWEAALETGNVDNAFSTYNMPQMKLQQQQSQSAPQYQAQPLQQQPQQIYSATVGGNQQFELVSASSSVFSSSSTTTTKNEYQSSKQIKDQIAGRELAYRPNVPQGWGLPKVVLPPEIFDSTQNYLELIRQMTPTPPPVEYQARCGQPEVTQYEEPVQELINVIETDSRESTPDYQPLPVKDLISTFEQGTCMPPDLTSMTSSFSSSEQVTKISSSTSSSSNFNSLPPLQQPFGIQSIEEQQQQQKQQQQQQQQQQKQQSKPVPKPNVANKQGPPKHAPQTPPKPNQHWPPQPQPQQHQSWLPQQQQQQIPQQVPQQVAMMPQQMQQQMTHQMQHQMSQQMSQITKTTQQQYASIQKTPPAVSPAAELKVHTPTPRSANVSPRPGFNSSSVTAGILKKQIQLDAAVPVLPGQTLCPSPINVGRNGGKSPVPFMNTAPAPFGVCPGLSVQTPQSIAEFAPSTALVPPLQNPPALPLIVNTPLPQYSSTYNTTARPFSQFKDFYRPVNMDSVNHTLVPPVVYTDF